MDIIEELLQNTLTKSINSQKEFLSFDNNTIIEEYMKYFSSSLRKVLEASQQDTTLSTSSLESCAPAAAQEENNQLEDEVEKACIEYEAVLIATTRQRSKAPRILSELRGSALRHRQLTAGNHRVDLPFRSSLECSSLKQTVSQCKAVAEEPCNTATAGEVAGKSCCRGLLEQFRECEEQLSVITREMSDEVHRHRRLNDAMQMLSSRSHQHVRRISQAHSENHSRNC